MANVLETTFKSLQSDERYKKLERTLKMALLRNAERASVDNGNTGQWPNVSSINGDHLDTSLAATSVQSSRIGSEVVSSSTNLRNILLHKQQFDGSRNNAATSSENQFPTGKDNDSVMMPPPRIPTIGGKRLANGSHRAPLVNMPIDSERNANSFSISTPASIISSIAKCAGSMNVDSRTVYQENNNCHARSGYGETVSGGVKNQERNFDKWRVLLNDKGQLIIKGTLECGKVARSKPVIRRLTPTSVQSIFKHTYHLKGNLVDDRGELPDYVRGKFYDGFPDDWENVYQVWRNFVSDGNRLSFRWPTPMTDSDDDIKSEITEISYLPARPKRSVSPTKRSRSTRSSSIHELSVVNDENQPDPTSRSRSNNASLSETLEKSVDTKNSTENSQRNRSTRLKEFSKENANSTNNQKSHDRSANSLNSTDTEKNNDNPFAGIISEDKLNRIIDNLTNKNCPIEYINKIVEMFDCMKYIVSYHSSVENESLKETTRENDASSAKKHRTIEKKIDEFDTSSSKNRANIPRPSVSRTNRYDDEPTLSDPRSALKESQTYKETDRQTRKKLSKRDYESSESDNDFYNDDQQNHRFTESCERFAKPRKYNNSGVSVGVRTRRIRVNPEKSPEKSRKHRVETIANVNDQTHDSSITDEEFAVEKKRDVKSENDRGFMSPKRIVGSTKKHRKTTKNYESSISFTDDEKRYVDEPKSNDIKKDNYDSSVSITEDEHGDVNVRNRTNLRNYHAEKNVFSAKPEMRRNVNYRDNKNRSNDQNYYSESNLRPLDESVMENGDDRCVRRRLDSLDYYSETNSRQRDENIGRNSDNRDVKKRSDSMDYHRDSNFITVERDTDTIEITLDDKKRLDSLKFHVESNSCRDQNDINKNNQQRNFRSTKKTHVFAITPIVDDNLVSGDRQNSNVDVREGSVSSNLNRASDRENDSNYLGSVTKRNAKKSNGNRARMEIETDLNSEQSSPEIREMPGWKGRTTLGKKKPVVISTETVNVDLGWCESKDETEIVTNAGNSSRNYVVEGKTSNVVENDVVGQIDTGNEENFDEPVKLKLRSKEGSNGLRSQDGKSLTRENKIDNVQNVGENASIASIAKYGTVKNPKLLTAWVPVVIFDENGDKKFHLTFEGKLLNEAGHVTNRKFATDIVQRRLSPKIIETISHEFYNLVGELHDTQNMVPKELIKLCQNGCPGRIGNFCEKWKASTGDTYKTPPRALHNTSVDCLSVPMSSRGRRILPPLNYWAGERVVTKDNKTMYNPGSSQESSLHSSLENTIQEVKKKKYLPKARNDVKGTNECKSSEAKKKNVEKISPPKVDEPTAKSPSVIVRGSQNTRSAKRRMTRNMQFSSSESDDGEETKAVPRKRKPKTNEVVNTKITSTRQLRNSAKNSASPQNPEHATISPKKNSFERPSNPEVKLRFRKRPKIDDNQGTMQQFVTRKPLEIKCTYYKSQPMHDCDLSEDQLSAM